LTGSAPRTPCEAALPSAAFRYFAGTQPLQHGDHRQQPDLGPQVFRLRIVSGEAQIELGSEMIESASCPTAVLSISFFLTVWVTPENQSAELLRLFCFYGKFFGVPKWCALSKSRVTIDSGTAGSRELEGTAVSIIAHTPVTPKASLRTDACCAVPVDDSNSLGPCGSGNRLVPQISAQFKGSVHLFSHGELDRRHE
jgi:hypothetical protein